MNRTDRLLAIVLELQSKGRQRAEDLAATFETSKRTIYRDIEALSQAGVPLLAVPGQGYELMEGYFLPPLSFTAAEASTLLLGSGFVAQNLDAEYRSAAHAAAQKIEGVLPEKERAEVRKLQSNIHFLAQNIGDPPVLRKLRQASFESRTVQFRYHARSHSGDGSSAPRLRQADPYGLAFYRGAWYMSAFCHTNQDVRRFRLDRIEDLTVLSDTFERPADFKLEQGPSDEDRVIKVQVLFDASIARWVKEAHHFFIEKQEENDLGLLVTMLVRHERDVIQWLLGWGKHARVLEPESLRQQLAEEARGILENYQNPNSY